MRFILLTALLFQAVCCNWLQETKLVKYVTDRVECKPFNPKYIEKVVCSTKVLSRYIRSHKQEIYFRPEFKISNVFIEIKTYKKFGTVYRPTLIVLKENFCDLVGNNSNSYVAQVIRPWVNQNDTNFFKPCPLMGQKFRYWTSDSGSHPAVPPLMPIGEWKLSSKLLTNMTGVMEFLVELVERFEVKQITATQF